MGFQSDKSVVVVKRQCNLEWNEMKDEIKALV